MVRELIYSEFDLSLEPIFNHISAEAGQKWRYNPDYMYQAWQSLMLQGIARTWHAPGCVLGALFYPDIFSGALFGAVHFWWSLPEVRGTGVPIRVFKAFEAAAKEARCKTIFSCVHEDTAPHMLERVYPRLGYRLREMTYAKEL